jgi:uncharacterized heparinase superfamily protein
MGPTPAELLMTLQTYDETHGAALSNAPYSGYQHLEAGGSVLIMDTGRAPPLDMSLEAHAGCLSFEFSSPKQALIIVNCGIPPIGRDDWRRLARSTAAHSTVTFNETSSARFVETAAFQRFLGGSPMFGGPTKVTVTREDGPDAIMLHAVHDGYADRYGIVHERTLVLAADGTRLEGEDMFVAAAGSARRRGDHDQFAVRFHLHPSIKTTRLTDGRGVMLMAPNKEVWMFNAQGAVVELEDGVYLAATDGPRRTVQMVIHGQAHITPRVLWSFQQTSTAAQATASATRRAREDEPRLPL